MSQGMEFTSRYKYGDLVWFSPAGDIRILAVVLGCIIKGPKVAYHLGLNSGAEVRTYGDRVLAMQQNEIVMEEDADFFNKMLVNCGPEL